MKDLIPVKFNEEVVITTKMLAEVYECEDGNITWNFNHNKDKKVNIITKLKAKNLKICECVFHIYKFHLKLEHYIFGLREVHQDIVKC